MTGIYTSMLLILQATLAGTVTVDGTPSRGINLTLSGPGIQERMAATGPDGAFRFEDVPAGIYEVTVARGNQRFVIPSLLVENGRNEISIAWPMGDIAVRRDRFQTAFSLGAAALGGGRYDDAIREFREALSYDTTQSSVWASMALAAVGARRYDDALEYGHMAIRLAPAQAAYRNNLGSTHYRMGRFDDAIQRYQEASELNPPGRGLYLSNIAAARLSKGDQSGALEAYREAVADPNVPAATHYHYGALLDRAGDSRGAINAFRRYIEVAPAGPHAPSARTRLQALGG